MLVDDDAAQRRTVVLRDETALAHLAIRNEGEHLAGGSVDGQRDVGEQIDVDHLAGEQLDGVGAIARDQHEGRTRVGRERGES